MTMRPIRGWKARQEAGQLALKARERGESTNPVFDNAANRERQEMILAKDAADRAYAAEVQRKRAITVVECTCCSGKGYALLNDVAAMTEALSRYSRVGWTPSPDTIAKLLPLAFDVDADGERITAVAPAPVIPSSETGTDEEAEALAELVNETPRKAKARHVVPPHLDD